MQKLWRLQTRHIRTCWTGLLNISNEKSLSVDIIYVCSWSARCNMLLIPHSLSLQQNKCCIVACWKQIIDRFISVLLENFQNIFERLEWLIWNSNLKTFQGLCLFTIWHKFLYK
jgi:hypothetical protein